MRTGFNILNTALKEMSSNEALQLEKWVSKEWEGLYLQLFLC